MKASELVALAYYNAGILDPEEDIPARYGATGIFWLNSVIADWSSIPDWIMFLDQLNFTTQSGKHEYTISKLPNSDVFGEPITLLVASHLTWGGTRQTLRQVFETMDNAQSYDIFTGMPVTINLRESEFKTTVRLFPTPNQAYHIEMLVKARRDQVSDFEELLQITIRAQSAFIYELSRRLLVFFQFPIPSSFTDVYDDIVPAFLGANGVGHEVNRDVGLTGYNGWWNWNGGSLL